ncbi:hypothetical protein [Leptospira terpstrae]|uniref:Uncharacterized protein n=1 Tax=Leptospira terpstrae serovar Hualin str. LT 11-33 = ATCC 700639 TaxID=1257025 RepID=N1VSK0_9LEPT|nr:hypothetical protein [Leptospira terpstrae]EMY60000.1 hypothetical protein LEP1GSC203_1072 [Leptospira terpstrae serovar Hualin str. LT 11-33 = ATCC 700639]
MKLLLTFIFFFIGCASFRKEQNPIIAINLKLPISIEWKLITDKNEQNESIKEWVPNDKDVQNSDWIIAKQSFRNTSSAYSFLNSILNLAKSHCTDILSNPPQESDFHDYESYTARFMCAQQIGKDYGTITEMRVISDNTKVFVITSERRLSPTAKAGQFQFKSPLEIIAFSKKNKESTEFVRNSIELCSSNCN